MTIKNDKGQTPDDVCKGFPWWPAGMCTHDDLQSWARLLAQTRRSVRQFVSAKPGNTNGPLALAWADSKAVNDFIEMGKPMLGTHSRETIEALVGEIRLGNDWLERLGSPVAVDDTPEPGNDWGKVALATAVIYFLATRGDDY